MPKIPGILFRLSEPITDGLADVALLVTEKTNTKSKFLEKYLPSVMSAYSAHCTDKKALVSPFEISNNLTL